MQNARVEVIDLWHFLISLSMCVGLKPDDILDVYRQKHAVNRQRQDNGYSRATKDESDNLEIG
jgi:dimeric dUTPase (all-alpha-NTP-PPase superfamily)